MAISLPQALDDPNLLRSPPFADLTPWRSWIVALRAVYGLPLDANGKALFCKHTGRGWYDPPAGGFPEAAFILGRQSGKSRAAATIAAYEAMIADPEPDGTEVYCLLLAQDHRAALRTLFSYARAAVECSPLLRNAVVSMTAQTIRLDTGVTIAAYPARPESIRGLRARIAVCDELAFYRGSDYRPIDTEMLRALRPALATTGGRLIVISSPYAQAGALWDLRRRHYGQDDSDTLVWQASAPEMHPLLPADYLARMERDDPEAYRSEVLGEFRSGISTLLDPERIQDCVADRLELPPVSDATYAGFVDPSGGRRDAVTLAIGHRDGDRAVVDCLRGWPAPHNPGGVVAEMADLLRQYRVHSVTGDRFGGEFPREQFRAHGIRYELAQKNRSDLYLELVGTINSGAIELPAHDKLLAELRGLERRRGPSGKDRVDHVPGAHDD